jgi:hypothetical protein
VAALRQKGQEAALRHSADGVVAAPSGRLERDTVVLIMSNGPFDNIHEKLLSALRARSTALRNDLETMLGRSDMRTPSIPGVSALSVHTTLPESIRPYPRTICLTV